MSYMPSKEECGLTCRGGSERKRCTCHGPHECVRKASGADIVPLAREERAMAIWRRDNETKQVIYKNSYPVAFAESPQLALEMCAALNQRDNSGALTEIREYAERRHKEIADAGDRHDSQTCDRAEVQFDTATHLWELIAHRPWRQRDEP